MKYRKNGVPGPLVKTLIRQGQRTSPTCTVQAKPAGTSVQRHSSTSNARECPEYTRSNTKTSVGAGNDSAGFRWSATNELADSINRATARTRSIPIVSSMRSRSASRELSMSNKGTTLTYHTRTFSLEMLLSIGGTLPPDNGRSVHSIYNQSCRFYPILGIDLPAAMAHSFARGRRATSSGHPTATQTFDRQAF